MPPLAGRCQDAAADMPRIRLLNTTLPISLPCYIDYKSAALTVRRRQMQKSYMLRARHDVRGRAARRDDHYYYYTLLSI